MDAPLAHWDGLSSWLGQVPTGHLAADLAVGADADAGLEARLRAGYGLTPHLSLGAEAYWQRRGGVDDFGAVAGVRGEW